MYKEDCDLYFLIYNKHGKLIAELPIKKYKFVEKNGGYPLGNIYINEKGEIYEMYQDKKGVHILKHTVVNK